MIIFLDFDGVLPNTAFNIRQDTLLLLPVPSNFGNNTASVAVSPFLPAFSIPSHSSPSTSAPTERADDLSCGTAIHKS